MGRPRIAGTRTAGSLGSRDFLGALVLMFPLLVVLLMAFPLATQARQVVIPEPLRPWQVWVEQKHPEHACPTLADGGRLCVAQASLDLDLGESGGSFSLLVTTFGHQWVELPGDAAAWPLETRLRGGAQVPVVQRSGRPQAFLPPGEHVLEGRFAWAALPTSLAIPSRAARLGLKLRGRIVEGPEGDGNGRLLLEGKVARADLAGEAPPLSLRVYRKLVDDIPMRVETLVELAVPGGEREILTGRLLPVGSAILSLASDMPVRVEPDGRLRAQLQPGDRSVHVTARLLAPAVALGMERLDSLWPAQEIWTFEARRDIRVVELAGAPLVDPSQTGLPEDWKGLPAYRLGPGDTLRIVEKQRGNPSPQAGALNLSRQLWLDFSGKGYTQKDAVTGRLFRRTRLEMHPGAELGRAEISGRPVMITSLEGRAGVEAPAGDLNLVALSRHGRENGFSREVTGWNQGFQSLQVGLHLPPGWRLVHADGPDGVANSWVSDWSLWDVFLLCILTLGMLRLTGWLGALLALATFVLLSQEPGLDGLLWLNLLAAVGLVRVLGVGRLQFWARRYAWASLALLAALWIPFAITHVREALYPQLDSPGGSAYGYANLNMLDLSRSGSYGSGRSMENAASLESDEMEKAAEPPREPLARSGKVLSLGGRQLKAPQDASIYSGQAEEDEGMTHAKVQTGPGEPAWGWESARLSWSGPVQEGETMRLYLMPPWLTRLARTLQALLPGVLLLLLGLSSGINRPGSGGDVSGSTGPRLPIAVWSRIGSRLRLRGRGVAGMALLFLTAAPSVRAQFPPDTLLRELEQRLLAPPACAPTCVAMASGAVAIAGDRLRVVLVFDAVDTAVAILPRGGQGQWALESLRLDERPAAAAARLSGGGPAVVVPPGRHRVLIEGRILTARLELAFGEGARHLTVEAPGYAVQGLKDGRAEGGTLVFLRREAPAGQSEARRALAPDAIPPYIEVHRTLELAQEWILVTRVLRVAPASGAFSVEVPLLPFEHPLSPGMASDKGSTLASFQEGQSEVLWRSTVDRRDTLTFAAGDLARLTETWGARAASRWHLETSGPAPMQSTPDQGLAAWRPIPGDTLVLVISEPRAASGPVKTVESASLSHSPGRREASTSLTLAYRAGQGDAARIILPAGARLDNLTVDGMSQPLTQREGVLSLPLKPGLQQVVLGWKQPTGISTLLATPRVELGDPAANVSVSMTVPGDRWVLWVGGPAAGPALLFWGVAIVLGILGWCLGRWGRTPLGKLDWILLFLGTSTVNVYAAAPLLGLMLILRWREKEAPRLERRAHNLLQVLLAGLALLAFGILVGSVPQGLLSAPDMQITGNGSHAHELRWFVDRVQGALPSGRMLSLPLWAYRLAMLAWSLWLALRLLRWLRWCWERYSIGGLWRERPAKGPGSPAPT